MFGFIIWCTFTVACKREVYESRHHGKMQSASTKKVVSLANDDLNKRDELEAFDVANRKHVEMSDRRSTAES